MTTPAKNIRTCAQGHQYSKSSDCHACPVCEAAKKPAEGFLSLLSAPARRALQNTGITTLHKLAQYSKTEILALHGIGPSSIPRLEKALGSQGLHFKK